MDAFGTFLYPYYILLYIFIYIILSTSPKLKRLLGMMVGWAIVSETNCSDYMVDFAASYSIAARPAAGINMNELAWHRPVSTDLMPCRIWPTAVLLRQPPKAGNGWNNFQDPEEIPIPGGANSTPSIGEHKVFNLLLDPVLPTAGVPSAGTACEQFMRSWS